MKGPGRQHGRRAARAAGRSRWAHGAPGALLLGALLLAAGCRSDRIDAAYGRRRGVTGGASVNGVGVLADMFAVRGHRVATERMLSPSMERYDVIIWAPDSFEPPGRAQRKFFEDWLLHDGDGGRTLVYIGRDFDAEPQYWRQLRDRAPPELEYEVVRRWAQARSRHDAAREQMPDQADAAWFVVRGDQPRRTITKVESDDPRWAAAAAGQTTDIHLQGLLLPPAGQGAKAPGGAPPVRAEVLLRGGGQPLLFRLTSQRWEDAFCNHCQTLLPRLGAPAEVRCPQCGQLQRESQILVAANGSFLLNLPLVHPAHRRLAAALIDACGPSGRVAVLESGPGGPPVVRGRPRTQYPTGFAIFTTWPLSVIALHLSLLGVFYLLSRWPVFGEPRRLEPPPLSDFGKHVEAVGELLWRTGQEPYARRLLDQYRQGAALEPSGSRAAPGSSPPVPSAPDHAP